MGSQEEQKIAIKSLLRNNMLWGSKELVLRIANERKKRVSFYEEESETWE